MIPIKDSISLCSNFILTIFYQRTKVNIPVRWGKINALTLNSAIFYKNILEDILKLQNQRNKLFVVWNLYKCYWLTKKEKVWFSLPYVE